MINWQDILGWNLDQINELRVSGFSYLREGHYQKALLFFEALTTLDPNSLYDIQTLGALYLEMGETEKSLRILNRALELDPIHEPTLLNKVKALLTLNQKNEALRLAQTLVISKEASIADDARALIIAYSQR